jgi:hypothetical protein
MANDDSRVAEQGNSRCTCPYQSGVINMQVGQMRDLAVFQQALHLLAIVEDNRNERLDSADGSVPMIYG